MREHSPTIRESTDKGNLEINIQIIIYIIQIH